MTPEQLSRIREIYEKALSVSGSDREAFLDRECGGNNEIRKEIHRLFAAREQVPAWLDQPAMGAARPPEDPPELPKLEGRHVGGYTLVREIGRGGMGRVFLAERSDGAFRKQAAVKLLLPGANIAEVIARFQQEREILASLDHPNIARLLDGGVTEEGWPYFVMEYVEGQPIHRWCDERKLTVSQRIELFRNVLAAVRYAHQRLVVHRDLKPGNIFVTNDGVVKLLDFGIAKVVSAKDRGESAETVTLMQMMTPEYASPEQVKGAAITTLSDVYSLGVILYELLTGHRPYRLLRAAMHEVARVIAEVEPTRPSEIVTTTEPGYGRDQTPITPDIVSAVREGEPGRLQKRLSGDLDSILLTALRKEPERRYSSAETFAEDLERHQANRPVAAREATPWYRVRRWCRRNPGGVAAGVLVLIPILTGLLAMVWQTRRELIQSHGHPADATAFVVVGFGVALVALGFAVFLARPGRGQLLASFAGGAVWAGAGFADAWISHALGWWRSRFEDVPEPLSLFGQPIWTSPYPWVAQGVLLTAVLFLVSWIHRRFAWKGALIFLGVLSVWETSRARYWFTILLPVLEYKPGWSPFLSQAAIFAAGGLLGLIAKRMIEASQVGREV
jgi:serine/threonine protein kinase